MRDDDMKDGAGPDSAQGKFVTFTLGADMYSINVMNVQEVMKLSPVGYVPDTMPYMKGVLDLRGKMVPAVDLRIKFGLDEKPYDEDTIIVIVEVHGELVGLIVDSVVDVLSLGLDEIQQPPHFTASIDKDSVRGIVKISDGVVIILDVEKIISREEMQGMLH